MTVIQPIGQGNQYYPEIKSVKEFPDYYEYTFKDEASTGKKWGVGLGSFFIPGLGQAINGQWAKAAGMFAGKGVLMYLTNKAAKAGKVNIPVTIAHWALGGYAAYDAVKNADGEFKQNVPKESVFNSQA